MASVTMSPEAIPPTATAGPPPALADMPVTPNVIAAESIPAGSVTRPESEKVSIPVAVMPLPRPWFPGLPVARAEAEKSPVTQLPEAPGDGAYAATDGGVHEHA
jgi:hypothetical protein